MKSNTDFNWYIELDKAILNEPSEKDHSRLKLLSFGWPTCACGQLCDALPRSGEGAPLDPDLFLMGLEFCNLIESKSWALARSILGRIETQTSYLLINNL